MFVWRMEESGRDDHTCIAGCVCSMSMCLLGRGNSYSACLYLYNLCNVYVYVYAGTGASEQFQVDNCRWHPAGWFGALMKITTWKIGLVTVISAFFHPTGNIVRFSEIAKTS